MLETAIPAIPNTLNTLSFSLLPNPAGAFAPVTLALAAKHAGGRVQLSDLNGRIIAQQDIPPHAHSVQLPGLPRGWYIIQVKSGTQQGSRLLWVE